MKNLLIIPIIFWLFTPYIASSQQDEISNYIHEINKILEQHPSYSSSFNLSITTVYQFEERNNNLIITEEISSSNDEQKKEFMLPFNEIISKGIIVNSDNSIINIRFGVGSEYINYWLYNSEGSTKGMESDINIYTSNLQDEDYNTLANLIRDLFDNIPSSSDQYSNDGTNTYNEYYYSYSEEENDYYQKEEAEDSYSSDYYYNNNYDDYNAEDYYKGNSTETNYEYYDENGTRVYNKNEAYYFRKVEYNDEGKLVAFDYLEGEIPYRAAQLAKRDSYNRNNDVLDGECIWFYEDGKPHFYAIYENGYLKNNEYAELEENGNITVIFDDDFKDNRNEWPLVNNSDIYSDISNGTLIITSKNNYLVNRLIKYKIDAELDFIISSRIMLIYGDNKSGQGIIWGFKDWDNYNRFRVSGNGYYEIATIHDGIELSDGWQKSNEINEGNNWNKLQINKYGDKIYFSVNSKIIKESDFYPYRGNNIGFILGPNRKIKAENFVVKQKLGNINSKEEYAGKKDGTAKNDNSPKATGSGIVVSTDGYIVTNYHVAGNANALGVIFYENNERKAYKAKYIIGDTDHDLAIIKIVDEEFKGFYDIPYNLKIDDSDIGEKVFTLGYPFASYMGAEIIYNEGTISAQSGLGRDDTHYQISVPVQPGNSGGPLFDYDGNLIGIVDSRTEQIEDRRAENIAYAIKTYYVNRLINQLTGYVAIPSETFLQDYKNTEKIKILKEFIPIILVY